MAWGYAYAADPLAHATTQKMRLCPRATTLASDAIDRKVAIGFGGTFLAWGPYYHYFGSKLQGNYGSYGLNFWCYSPPAEEPHRRSEWQTADVRGADRVPVMLDSAHHFTDVGAAHEPPPAHDSVPVAHWY